ncbi:MotE family protein [Tenuibacillus multivorans]|uniref:Flagellar motility protein MotE, a chaperone for MotC folding n=1 Tax=Tenuibacillus multivorans TaxID=237069 RepID=A0A1G9Y0K1_9BACI|nr:hypothetical protein [Tenuibacillus multivorans]GEL75876.1 hypothetical protein TMU01_01110 [Tenuibacillus multivorans]SDN01943.1 Flagellar motility protein MotE, a chaperone for MotC folding [Tenuibacillus multivorans]
MASINQETKQTNKFQWFFFVVIIPILFATTLALVISTIAGVNPFQKVQEFGSQVPFLSGVVDDPEEEEEEQNIAKYEALVKDQEAKIENLEAQISEKDQNIEELQQQISEFEDLLAEQEDNRIKEEEAVSKLSSSFAEMEATQAANILIEMDHSLAIKVLVAMPNEVRGEILSSMEAEDAALFSNDLFSNSN